jgi:ADP-heptose:LPS heptosyltransferase
MAGERGNTVLRLLDRWAGIPLVFAAGLTHRKRKTPPAVLRRVGVLCLGCIGDLVLLSGPLADLAAAHPDCRITMFCSQANAGLAPMLPIEAEVVTLPIKNPLRAIAMIRARGPFDTWLDSSQWPRIGAALTLAARAAYTVGFSSPGQHRHYVYDAVVPHERTRHELENFRALLANLGVTGNNPPQLKLRKEPRPSLPGGWPDGPFAVLHMFPGGVRSHLKMWPRENWAELVRALMARGLTLLFSGASADALHAAELAAELASPQARSIAGASLEATAHALAGAAVTISVNTGIMHMAAALDSPLVALNGPTSIERWGPVTQPGRGEALSSSRTCAPCLHLGFEYGCAQGGCMADITVEAVLAAADRLLAISCQRATG